MKPCCLPAHWGVTVLFVAPVKAPAAVVHGLPFRVAPDPIANHDILVWSLLTVLALTLGLVGACVWGIFRPFHKIAPEQRLLEELKEQLRHQPTPAAPAAEAPTPAPPWEKPADWWKNPPLD